MNESIEKNMRTLKLSGLAKDWRTVEYRYGTEQYVRDLMELELREREANRIKLSILNRISKSSVEMLATISFIISAAPFAV